MAGVYSRNPPPRCKTIVALKPRNISPAAREQPAVMGSMPRYRSSPRESQHATALAGRLG